MHFEILVEDKSGEKLLGILVPKIIGNTHTFRIHSYKGIGRIPENMKSSADACKRILLDRLPAILNGYGKTQKSQKKNGFQSVVFVVCDLDRKCLKEFRQELLSILDKCKDKPEAYFCIAIEEGEAWLLGDISAVIKAYPDADKAVLKKYKNDSVCGTWETLADAVYPGGRGKLCSKEYWEIGLEKTKWAEKIAPYINISANLSPSFQYFCNKLKMFI